MRFHWITLIMIYLVIIAGSIVRITESGMGCPDWPKCFDQYIPPTNKSDLPNDYRNYYSLVREKKIQKFTEFLSKIGLEDKAELIKADKTLLYEQPFNVWNTWLEYVNRLIGALAGLFILAGFFFALIQKENRFIKGLLGFGLIILTLFQAWWGSMVVATNIVPWVLTVHMVIASLMIAWQILIISVWSNSLPIVSRAIKIFSFIGIIIFLFQIILGTQVRQIVDHWLDYSSRSNLILENFKIFISHRTMALIIVVYSIILMVYSFLKKQKLIEINIFLVCVLIESVVGKVLADYHLPYLLQPVHLFLAMVSFGCMTRLFFNYKHVKN